MNDEQIQEILNDPQKMLNFFRLFHQLLHLYDEKEMKKQLEQEKGTNAQAGLGDTLNVVLKDKEGNVKTTIQQ